MGKKVIGAGLLVLALIPVSFMVFVLVDLFQNFDEEVARVGPIVAIGATVLMSAFALMLAWILAFFGVRLIRTPRNSPAITLGDSEVLEINFSNTRFDLYKFQLYASVMSRRLLTFYGFLLIGGGLLVVHSGYGANQSATEILSRLAAFEVLAIPLLLVLLLLYPLVLYVPWINKKLLAPQKLILSKEGITEESPSNAARYQWSSVTKVRLLKNYLVIYILGDRALVIPARSFETAEDFKRAGAIARAYYEAARE